MVVAHAPERGPSLGPPGQPGREEVILSGRLAPDVLGGASVLFASCLGILCRRAERILRAERRELRHSIHCFGPQGRLSSADAADLKACERSLRRVRRISRHPLPQARRQMRRLAALLGGSEFKSLKVSRRAVVARVEPARVHSWDRDVPAFEICFAPGDRNHAPIMIRRPGTGLFSPAFVRIGAHGACRGGATPLIEAAEEQADVPQMFLIVFTWALQNLQAPSGGRTDVVRG